MVGFKEAETKLSISALAIAAGKQAPFPLVHRHVIILTCNFKVRSLNESYRAVSSCAVVY